ncbi:PE-PPE domain-containing protein [Gordonia polyisoprenivorans]|uniref:PE-PPE domain-containing protein n=1 Tax=Gordonia polyisoprenivorans TaxID=84595 RepID=UPI001F0AABF3|nr:PE-PPE domain-containing protein [Gordonia polyisoprenivorans]
MSTPMPQELRGELCHSPNTCQVVVYPSGAIGGGALQEGATALTADIASTPGKKIVFAYSQGGMIATTWLQDTAGSPSAPPASDLVFVLVGNPQRGLNGQAPTLGVGSATPTDTGYTVIDVSREYDAESDFPNNPFNGLAVANAIAGYFLVHTDYTGVDVDDPNNLVQTVGGTTYVLVPTTNLPLLEPLRMIGLSGVADQLNGPLKTIVDQGYNRTGYTTLGDDPAAQQTIGSVFGTTATTNAARSAENTASRAAARQGVAAPAATGYAVTTSATSALGTPTPTSAPAATTTTSAPQTPIAPASATPSTTTSSSPTSESGGYVGRHRAPEATADQGSSGQGSAGQDAAQTATGTASPRSGSGMSPRSPSL